jgi:hypothetical protein
MISHGPKVIVISYSLQPQPVNAFDLYQTFNNWPPKQGHVGDRLRFLPIGILVDRAMRNSKDSLEWHSARAQQAEVTRQQTTHEPTRRELERMADEYRQKAKRAGQ